MVKFVMKKKPKEKENEEGETKSSVSSKKRPAEEESQGLDLEILESTSTLSKTSASATASSSSSKSKKKKPSEADEKKEKRTFKPMWTVGRPWLTFDGKAMFCSICKSQALKSQKGKKQWTFITGCTNLRVETIRDHETSATHTLALTVQENKQKPFSEKPAVSAWVSLNTSYQTKVKRLMRNTHVLMKHGRPMRDYEWMYQSGDSTT